MQLCTAKKVIILFYILTHSNSSLSHRQFHPRSHIDSPLPQLPITPLITPLPYLRFSSCNLPSPDPGLIAGQRVEFRCRPSLFRIVTFIHIRTHAHAHTLSSASAALALCTSWLKANTSLITQYRGEDIDNSISRSLTRQAQARLPARTMSCVSLSTNII